VLNVKIGKQSENVLSKRAEFLIMIKYLFDSISMDSKILPYAQFISSLNFTKIVSIVSSLQYVFISCTLYIAITRFSVRLRLHQKNNLDKSIVTIY
jgi:hypothetical protein